MITYEEYRQLRRDCGYWDDYGFIDEQVWNGWDEQAQQGALAQYRAHPRVEASEAAARPAGWASW